MAYIDGASRGNPGEGGVGVFFQNKDRTPIFEAYKYIGKVTNNIAEYKALILALKKAQQLNAESLTLYSDSQLIVNQVNGKFRVKDVKLKPLLREALSLIRRFPKFQIEVISREENRLADSLANRAIDIMGEGEKFL